MEIIGGRVLQFPSAVRHLEAVEAFEANVRLMAYAMWRNRKAEQETAEYYWAAAEKELLGFHNWKPKEFDNEIRNKAYFLSLHRRERNLHGTAESDWLQARGFVILYHVRWCENALRVA